MTVPKISALEVLECAKSTFPASKVVHETINPDFGSWRVTVGGKDEARWLEIVWGPLSGFGATDVRKLPSDDPDIFAPFDVALSSMEEARQWLAAKR